MINQVDTFLPESMTWIFALGLAFGISFVITFLIEGNEISFFIVFMVIIAFMTWGNLLDAWIFITVLVIFTILVIFELKTDKLNNG